MMASITIIISLLSYLTVIKAQTTLYHLKIATANTTFTIPFATTFVYTPYFAYYIESATIQNNQFSLNYDSLATTISNSQITINFIMLKSSPFISSEVVHLALLISDDQSGQFSIGIKQVDLTTTTSITFNSLTLASNNQQIGIISLYGLSFPLQFSYSVDLNQAGSVDISVAKSPSNYVLNVYFSYIFYTYIYTGQNVIALFQQMSISHYDFQVIYYEFAFQPTSSNTMFALARYDSSAVPFLNSQTINYNSIVDQNYQLNLGYIFSSGVPTAFRCDVFVFNSKFIGCQDGYFLAVVTLYTSLPYSCTPCDSTCLSCTTNSFSSPGQTDYNSCISCQWLRYLNVSNIPIGNCICYTGLEEINGECQECEADCLNFNVNFMESTNESYFLLHYSSGYVKQLLNLDENMQVFIDGINIHYDNNQQSQSVYIVSIQLEDMLVCEGSGCSIQFIYQYPQMVLSSDETTSLANNNITLIVDNFIDYYSKIPSQLRQALQILEYIVKGSYSGGASTLVTILFELEQLIDAHRYVNLTMPIIFNDLLNELTNFRFLELTNLFPQYIPNAIQSAVPNDLDNKGSPKLMYYDNGLNFYKNTIGGFMSFFLMLAVNASLYGVLRLIPFTITRKLAKKISIRKIITVHDNIEQFVLSFTHFALEQILVIILHSELVWIYGLALAVTSFIIAFPFLMVVYIYHNRHREDQIDIYQDLLQDNSIDQGVTYVYYIFNYYRKIMYAVFLLSFIPGLVQLYLLLTVNFIHLAFQIYLIVARTYKSKMKIIIRMTNDICLISLEVLIIVYNMNNYGNNTMINIGLTCLYLTITTTLMGILDVLIKIFDTLLQEIKSRRRVSQPVAVKEIMMKQFKSEMKCNIGQDLQHDKIKDPKELKFMQDKEIMENTFNDKEEDSDQMEINLEEDNHQPIQNQLVFIDQEWMDIYPIDKPQVAAKDAGTINRNSQNRRKDHINKYRAKQHRNFDSLVIKNIEQQHSQDIFSEDVNSQN